MLEILTETVASDHGSRPNDDVEKVIGAPPTNFTDFARCTAPGVPPPMCALANRPPPQRGSVRQPPRTVPGGQPTDVWVTAQDIAGMPGWP
jgi:hypothetical protein